MSLQKEKAIRVVGAGMNGLLSAYYLLENGFTVEVYEQDVRVGGKISTAASPFGIRELAANGLLADAEVEAVAEAIGVVLTEKKSEAKKRWILKGGVVRGWPLGVIASMRVFLFFILSLFKFRFISPRENEELLCDWSQRVLGNEATTYLLNPACLGIFGADSRILSAKLVYNYFFNRPQRSKKPKKLRGSVAPIGGMGEFPKKLKIYLEEKGVPFFLQQKMDDSEGEIVVLATDWRSASTFLTNSGDSRGEVLAKVRGVDLFSVNIFFNMKLEEQKQGFGVLFPLEEEVMPLGVLINSSIFPQRTVMNSPEIVSETWIFGAPEGVVFAPWSHEQFLNAVLKARLKIWGYKHTPLDFYVNPWKPAIPLYSLELEKALENLPVYENGIYLMGNYLGELGLTRFFHRAKEMAQSL